MELPHSIDSKYRFIIIAARRAQQLQSGARAHVQSASHKFIVIAQQEVCAGLVPFVTTDNHGNRLDAPLAVNAG